MREQLNQLEGHAPRYTTRLRTDSLTRLLSQRDLEAARPHGRGLGHLVWSLGQIMACAKQAIVIGHGEVLATGRLDTARK